ncbi:mannosyl-oligosaccharide glucosidase [Gracilaria domingensis]|nr:mannosyl-oligosaccharide glucosidase [Gracilaria domingensis]
MKPLRPLLDVENPPEERLRILDRKSPWRLFGTYLSDRQWGTVREDYSPKGEAWSWFRHDDVPYRAYRWGEDGLLGFCDERQLLNFSLSMWNGRDPTLKSRLWGLTNHEGIHGEDVKEIYFFEDGTPSSSYMKATYRYPMDEFPYKTVEEENLKRRKELYEKHTYIPEYELMDTGVFDDDRFYDVTVEYFKNTALDTFIAITIENCSDGEEELVLLPTLLFRNTWSWEKSSVKPDMFISDSIGDGNSVTSITCDALGDYLPSMSLLCEKDRSSILFCDNETAFSRFKGRSICRELYKREGTPYPKHGVDEYVISGNPAFVNPEQRGTKSAIMYVLQTQPKSKTTIRLRLMPTDDAEKETRFFESFEATRRKRMKEADAFYDWISPCRMSVDRRMIQRHAYAGMLWSRMTYIYNTKEWLSVGPERRRSTRGRNRSWTHFNALDIITACDGWEYPWFAAWDSAFHNVVFAAIDPEFAKSQVMLLMGPNYMSTSGQVPAYEWDLGDSNPPLQAWSAYKVYMIEKEMYGIEDISFLRLCYPRLNRFYTWFATSAEVESHIVGKSFLGLDNISLVDRSSLPEHVESMYQVDGTAWAAATALTMMKLSLLLKDESSEVFASQFFVDASFRAMALNNYDGDLDKPGSGHIMLYSSEDGFFYDSMKLKHDYKPRQLNIPTLVGLIPIVAIETLDVDVIEKRPAFAEAVRQYYSSEQHANLGSSLTSDNVFTDRKVIPRRGNGKSQIGVYAVNGEKLRRILTKVLDENCFFSEYGIRSASKELEHSPYLFDDGVVEKEYRYLPAESYGDGKMFGGNSSWRGSIWIPATYLIIESLLKYHSCLGDNFTVECPTGSGIQMNLREVAFHIIIRVTRLFEMNQEGSRPSLQKFARYPGHPKWRRPLYFEFFDGDNGSGLGATHQTGWTGLIADMLTMLSYEEMS